MKTDRSNYEVRIIDFLDGKLNESQKEELIHFLEANHDLKEELEAVSFLQPLADNKEFKEKHLLKKTLTEIPGSQFDFLCAGHYENDLNDEHEKELGVLLASDPERKAVFDQFGKLKLAPDNIRYPDKNSLKKNILIHGYNHLFIKVLSVAATITVLISLSILLPEKNSEIEPISNLEYTTDTITIKEQSPVFLYESSPFSETHKVNSPASPLKSSEKSEELTPVSSSIPDKINTANLVINPFFSKDEDKIIVTIKYEYFIADNDDDRTRIGRFLAKTYRDIILNEENATGDPIKGFELAEGGINGLNKLLGWEMALRKTSDEKGDVESVYFHSRMLKFNVPVKKEEHSE